MKQQEGINLPPSFTDLAFLLMFVFILLNMALLTEARQEYLTKVNLPQHRHVEGDGKGADKMSMAVTVNNGNYLFILESKKLGVKEFTNIKDAFTELQRLNPPELIIRADEKAIWKYPLKIMVESNLLGIPVSVASKKET